MNLVRNYVLIVVPAILIAASAQGQSVEKRLRGGYAHLRSGNLEGAMTNFRDVQTDAPESDLVYYSVARTQYEEGLVSLKLEAAEDAVIQFNAAKATFDNLTTSPDPFIRENALYSSANCAAQIAKNTSMLAERDETVAAFEDSIGAYEQVLARNPSHDGARRNLDHMRYLLKSMLQDPLPEQEQQSDGSDEENQDQEGEEEQEDGGESEEQSENDPEDDPEDSGEQSDETEEDAPPESGDSASEEEPQNRENIEAILQTLEDRDREEQKNLRKSKSPPRIRGNKWW